MQSLASAARLLAKCTSAAATAPLLAELGFDDELTEITPVSAEPLGLPPEIAPVMIARGKGGLRALAFEMAGGSDSRETMSRAAARLSSRAPQLLWLLVGVNARLNQVTIATFHAGHARTRVAALLVRLDAIVDSDSETICALASAVHAVDVHTHIRWVEILGRESMSLRFFRELERIVRLLADDLHPRVTGADSSALGLLYVSRLVFLSFLETKGWLDRDHGFLGNRYADCMVAGGGYHRRVLAPLFFGTLNTHPKNRASRAREFGRIPFLNGGLFARSSLETRTSRAFFSDEALGSVFADLLTRYRFTAREDASTWSEAAIDPEMLGKAFESLMSVAERKTSGAFYTPQSLVREVTASALSWELSSAPVSQEMAASALCGAIPGTLGRTALLESVDSVRILDPACGSGAFLVHILEELSALRVRLGDLRPLHRIRREILTRSIFGVDINPRAVWLCELRLWLCMAIEDPEPDPLRVSPLPNLDRNIRVGDSLSGEAFRATGPRVPGGSVASLRARYSRASGPRKKSLAKSLDRLERNCAIQACSARRASFVHERREIIAAVRTRDLFGDRHPPDAQQSERLASIRDGLRATARERRALVDGAALPFSFSTHFADVDSRGGFDLVIGNPPWVRTHNLDPRLRLMMKQSYSVYRNSAWTGGSEAAAAGKGFASQVDVAALFIERSMDLMREGGTCGLIVPAKLWRSLAGGGVRALLHERSLIREVHDLTDAPQLFDAAVYPSVIVASRCSGTTKPPSSTAAAHNRGRALRWKLDPNDLPFDSSRGSPWLIVPPEVRTAFDALVAAGVPFSRSVIGRPLLGVKTGCNDAFLVSECNESGVLPQGECRVSRDSAVSLMESRMLRPAIRGDRVTRWAIPPHNDRIIWTHDTSGAPMRFLPPHAMRWLVPRRSELEKRSDARGSARWWSLFRTESADSAGPRVVWSDIGKRPRAAVILAGDRSVPLNTCYVARCPTITDAFALTTLLNSRLVAAWLAIVAEPARGGYRRYMGWTMSILPLPREWERSRIQLASLAERAFTGDPPCDDEILYSALAAYRTTANQVEALLSWSG